MIKIIINEWGNPDKAYATKEIRLFGWAIYKAIKTTTSTAVTKNFNKHIRITGYEVEDKSKKDK